MSAPVDRERTVRTDPAKAVDTRGLFSNRASPWAARRGHVAWRLALVCCLLVVVIFGGYEVIERVWLREASPGVLHMLRLIRGIGTSVLVGLVIGWYILRRVPPIFPTAEATRELASMESVIEATLRQNARWFITTRWVVVGVTTIGVLIGVLGLRLVPRETLVHLLATIGGLAVSNLIFADLLPRVRRFDRFLTIQVVADLVLLTALLHFSGGIENPFSRVYIFHIVLAAILLPARQAYALTAVASVALSAMAFSEAAGLLTHYPIALFPYSEQAGAQDFAAHYWPFALGKVTSCLLVFWVTAYFAVLVRRQVRMREMELRNSWEKVRASERQLNEVVNSLGAGLILWSADQQLLWSNDVANDWMRLVEGERPESCRCPFARRARDGDGTWGTCVECATEKALSTGSSVTVERPHVLPDRRGRTLRVQAIPLPDENGRVTQVLEFLHDVTEQKGMEAEVIQATKMAALGRMAAALAHEIGNPIAAMATRLERMQEEGGAEFQQESVSLLGSQLGRIRRLVHEVTRFARSAPARSGRCDVQEVLRQVVTVVQMDPRARNVEIEVRAPDALPTVSLSRDQLTQVLLNLALNGVEAMPGGGRLLVSAEARDGEVRIELVDTGCGLDDEVKANLFRPFFTTKAGGTGLGLFLSHKLVCEVGGSLRADGEPGKGSRFELILPTSAPAERPSKASTSEERDAAPSHRG